MRALIFLLIYIPSITIAQDGLPIQRCTYQGKTYPLNSTWEIDDGCNTCKCIENDQESKFPAVACTALHCVKTPPIQTKYKRHKNKLKLDGKEYYILEDGNLEEIKNPSNN